MSLVIKCSRCEFETELQSKDEVKKCKSCKAYIIVQNTFEAETLSSVEKMKQQMNLLAALNRGSLDQDSKDMLNNSLGLIALESKSYLIAQKHFQKAVDENPDNAEAYYYHSLSLLNGQRPFLNSRNLIDQLIQNMDFALSLGMKGKYAYLKALLIHDFYILKSFRYPESVSSVLEIANALGVTDEEKREIFKILNMNKPANF